MSTKAERVLRPPLAVRAQPSLLVTAQPGHGAHAKGNRHFSTYGLASMIDSDESSGASEEPDWRPAEGKCYGCGRQMAEDREGELLVTTYFDKPICGACAAAVHAGGHSQRLVDEAILLRWVLEESDETRTVP